MRLFQRYSLSPATFLTKICIVSSAVADEAEDAEETEEMLLERMIAVVGVWVRCEVVEARGDVILLVRRAWEGGRR